MSFRTHGSRLFRLRGWAVACLGLLALTTAAPRGWGVVAGFGVVVIGCGLRCWAFSHLGAAGRTRDPRPPANRVVSGPYGFVSHPVYLSNLLIAAGLLVSASPPRAVAAGLFTVLAALYGVLGSRESRQLAHVVSTREGKEMNWPEVARSERSTWLQLALFQLYLIAQL